VSTGDIVKVRSINKTDKHENEEIGVIIKVDISRMPEQWILVSLESGVKWFWPSELELSLKE
jgi:hypothetical protein